MQDFKEDWQVEAQGQIYVADFEEIKQWIADGAILPSDKVKRGNLRWLTAEKVPELNEFFNSDDFNIAFSDKINEENFELEDADSQTQSASEDSAEENASEWIAEKVCYSHKDLEAAFVCDICLKSYCKACPKSYGGTVKICPLCDSLCRSIDEPVKIRKSVGAINKPYSRIEKNNDKLGEQNQRKFSKSKFSKAFVYLFNYLASLVWAVKHSIFSRLNKMRGQ